MENMDSTLKKYFGYSTYRPYQKEIIEKILEGKDCLVVMATGSGKSLCYQAPPLITKKTAIVISPLISLMQDQVMALKERGIKAEFLSSAQTNRSVQSNAESGLYDILYMTPEKACLLSTSFWSRLLKSGICLLAVDEAHCISEWGHDFRMEYKQLDRLRDALVEVPFVGLTATATEKVRRDIMNSLKMKDPHVAIGSFDRKNIFYGVKSFTHGSTFVNELVEEISKYVENANSTIIYCTTVKNTEEIFSSLIEAGIKAGIYNGQMSNKAREDAHRSFIRDEFYVMVATVAFGMGIDKPNIRHVIHYGCPKSLESYYQESGRCGRDGIPSICWLYYTRSDFAKADYYCREAQSADQRKAIMESFIAAQHYCLLAVCRRKYLLEYFGETCAYDKCGNCDNCTSSNKENDVSREAFLLIACIQSCGGRWGLNLPVDVLRGSRSKKILEAQFDKIPFHGLGKELPANWWKALAYQLISHGYLVETFDDVYRFVRVSPKGLQFLNSCNPDYQPPLFLPMTSEMVVDEGSGDTSTETRGNNGLASTEFEGLSQAETQLYKMLLEERMKVAKANGTAPYAICGDVTLKKISLTRPSTKPRLANIDGVNQHFMKTYGDHFLQSLKHLCEELNLSLDGERCTQNVQPSVSAKILTVPSNKKLTPAKFEAWKMWHEDGLSIQKIANFPGRAAPVKEQTIFEYILEAAREGYPVDWARFSYEIGVTREMFMNIASVVSRVGREKLKPIKTELPEEVTYSQIKAYLAMQELGISENVFPSNHQATLATGEQSKVEEPIDHTSSVSPCEEIHSVSNLQTESTVTDEPDFSPISAKRQKIYAPEGRSPMKLEATEESLLSWLKKFDDGASLSDLLEHFNGSTENSLVDLLCNLEGEFLIFRRNDVYKLM
ncbi:PREDICTED: uncharacterized protein LOC109162707 [Ipomoea nil]|uniref:uncharacterized protein LOC109162707 n=1 Tax=Ipomoea nil TaxID=35883 RepID=UPI000901C18E|nr:PREDICTED: uncharacterized protein LOC109162707 [Ipomoea nil]